MSKSLLTVEELGQSFAQYERDPPAFLIGAESEKFGVHEKTGRPLGYGGDFSVTQVLQYLQSHHGWSVIQESPTAPVIGLKKRDASITLEPSAQLELSGEPLADLHAIDRESRQHLAELAPISEQMGIAWLTTGFHPLCSREQLPWVPKLRYPIMRNYLPNRGKAGLDMMQRTATVQGNFDWSDEADAMKKMVVALKMSPLMQAWFSNAPFCDETSRKGSTTSLFGSSASSLSHRGEVWRNMDPSRSGLIAPLWQLSAPRYTDYVEWALDAGMFLIKREGQIIENTGQTFRDFMAHGYEGQVATLDDWKVHLTTLFPEVRLKNTLEVRAVDGLPPVLAVAALGVWTGILYDESSLSAAAELLSELRFEQVEGERALLIERGLHAPFCGADGFAWSKKLFSLAEAGLKRRGRLDEEGQSEAKFLAPAQEILELRRLPAEQALRKFAETGSLIEATRLSL